jgi:hypothetical protein
MKRKVKEFNQGAPSMRKRNMIARTLGTQTICVSVNENVLYLTLEEAHALRQFLEEALS